MKLKFGHIQQGRSLKERQTVFEQKILFNFEYINKFDPISLSEFIRINSELAL